MSMSISGLVALIALLIIGLFGHMTSISVMRRNANGVVAWFIGAIILWLMALGSLMNHSFSTLLILVGPFAFVFGAIYQVKRLRSATKQPGR